MGIVFLVIVGLIVACWIIKSIVTNIKERITGEKNGRDLGEKNRLKG